MSFFYWSKKDICQQATTNHQQEDERTDLMKSAGTPRYRPLSKSTIDGHRVQCCSENLLHFKEKTYKKKALPPTPYQKAD